MTTLTLAAMSAALVASFRSFPVAFLAGIGDRRGADRRSSTTCTTPGLSSSLPFAVIVLVLLFRGTSLPARGHFLQRLPRVGSGRVRPVRLLVAVAVGGR